MPSNTTSAEGVAQSETPVVGTLLYETHGASSIDGAMDPEEEDTSGVHTEPAPGVERGERSGAKDGQGADAIAERAHEAQTSGNGD